MGWFSEQIRQRTESDQNVLEDSFFRMASAVMDKWSADRLEDERLIAREALDDVLKYYHYKPAAVPDGITDVDKQMEYVLRPTGMMVREVYLEDNWQNDAFGPMLGYMKDTGVTVALIPGKIFGYTYRDPATGRKTRVTRRTAKLFAREAMCFYQPLPMKKLGIPDLLLYMKKCISSSDMILIVMATLAVTLVGMIEPQVYNLVTGTVMKTHNMNLLAGIAVFLLSSAFASQLINLVRTLLMNRINTKTSQAVEASVMMRILSLPVSFFRRFSSGELASRASSVSSLCSMILNNVLSVGLSSLMSLLYVTQIFHYAPELVWPSLLIIGATVTMTVATSLMQIGISRKKMKLSAEESGMSYAILNGIQKIRLSGSEKRVFARWGRLYSENARLEYNPPMFLKIGPVITTASADVPENRSRDYDSDLADRNDCAVLPGREIRRGTE